ncbi:MAG: hypothetical protein QOJ99_3860 [Bryobacterales bacterium]|jgi:hypothetical protein|nr:hypothetical protein [Bryobacterales bacterium]
MRRDLTIGRLAGSAGVKVWSTRLANLPRQQEWTSPVDAIPSQQNRASFGVSAQSDCTPNASAPHASFASVKADFS